MIKINFSYVTVFDNNKNTVKWLGSSQQILNNVLYMKNVSLLIVNIIPLAAEFECRYNQ